MSVTNDTLTNQYNNLVRDYELADKNSLIRDFRDWSNNIVNQYQDQLSNGSSFGNSSVHQSQVFTYDLKYLASNSV
ncbi:MAG: hypothetical protein LLF94_02330, partial [Chlamydiales bacterium]|nr:hypothetical protein [Chlamydiales bacterium]